MNQVANAPQNFQPASCPLLAAVLPLRYAIGPVTAQEWLTRIDAPALGLVPLSGDFPELGPDHPPLSQAPLGYVPRTLRDGWLYVWQDATAQLGEYQVSNALLTPTARGALVLDPQAQAYLLLQAGTPSMLAWSPVSWSDRQFAAAKAQVEVRQRVMRAITPGIAPFSGRLPTTRHLLADSQPQNYRWSCVPEQQPWQLNDPTWRRMQRCEQQHYAIVDDPWGVLIDLAGLLRARNLAFDKENLAHRDTWMVASILQELSEHDKQLKANLPSDTDYEALRRAWREQKDAADAVDFDRRRLATLWKDWLVTLGQHGPATLETACGHMDVTQPAARDMLEASFTAACLGPSATAIGAQALQDAMDLDADGAQTPWLVIAMLGLYEEPKPAEIKQLLSIPDSVEPLGQTIKSLARATALVGVLNAGASRLSSRSLAKPTEGFFAAMAPVLGGHMRSMSEHINAAAMRLLQAMLARSQQQLEVQALSEKQSLAWLNEQLEGAQNKSKRRRLKSDIARLEAESARNARPQNQGAGKAPTGQGQPSTIATQVKEYPHLNLVPAERPAAPAHPAPGYGSGASAPPVNAPKPGAADLPPLSRNAAKLELPLNVRDLLNDSPLKVLIAVVAVWNLRDAVNLLQKDKTAKNTVSLFSALLSSGTAVSAVFHQLADSRWEVHTEKFGKVSPGAQQLLSNALRVGAAMAALQSVTAGVDTILFGWDALDSYRAGDLDTAAINTGLSAASLGYMRVSMQMFRALRVARAAVMLGNAVALGRGVAVVPVPLIAQATGLVIMIFGGLAARIYTKDTPLEKWVKQTCFGTRPAEWSGSYEGTMRAYYQAVAPVSMRLQRWTAINPVTGEWVNEVRLDLLLEGQASYAQGMVSFTGVEEWTLERALLDSRPPVLDSVALEWGERKTPSPCIKSPAAASARPRACYVSARLITRPTLAD